MKKYVLIIIILLLFGLISFGQKKFEKLMDKNNVQTTTVLGHIFSVGDTIIFASGSMPNGDFVSAQMWPAYYYENFLVPPHITADNTNFKYIISKVRVVKEGLNTSTSLVINLQKDVNFWVDVDLAIAKKEIVLK